MTYKIELNPSTYLSRIQSGRFDDIALEVFRYQYQNNEIYRAFANALKRSPENVRLVRDIPFLPISFFKTHQVVSGTEQNFDLVFESSGTTGETPSRHYVRDRQLYEASLLAGFTQFYGAPEDYAILALLPSYLERKNASLVYMARMLMKKSGHAAGGFYLDEFAKLAETLQLLEQAGQKTLLLGVSFALLDFAAAFPMPLKHTIVMETGGMKGRREEWTREQVHAFLGQQWQLSNIHSEYGMTELLSQAYALEKGIFKPSMSMRVYTRDMNDPLDLNNAGAGCLNIIDLANLHSCSFIATEDIGRVFGDGSFEVLGRMDHAALRGCSLMTA